MNRHDRRAAAIVARDFAPVVAFALPRGVAYFDPTLAMPEGAQAAAEALARSRPLRIEQRNRLRAVGVR